MADVVVVGSFMMDHIAYAARRPGPGETVRGHGFVITEGGKGFNQAVAAARAGVSVAMIGRVGDDALGERFLARLLDEGIDGAGTVRDTRAGTGVGLPVVDDAGENAIVVIPGANDHVSAADVEVSAEALRQAKVLLIQREVPDVAGTAAARIVRAAGGTVVLNPAPAGPVEAYRDLVDVVTPNEGELELLGRGDDLVERAHDLSARLGGCVVLVTLGSAGVLVVDGSSVTSVPAEEVEAVDTTGAGDCFCGNLAARVALGDPLGDAVEYAVVAAGVAVGRPGGADATPAPAEIHPRIAARRASTGVLVDVAAHSAQFTGGQDA